MVHSRRSWVKDNLGHEELMMRRFLLSLLLASTYGGSAMAQSCMRPAEQQAFNIIGLKSSLMVGALSCSQRDQYDAFMTQFQPHILAEQHIMDSYFRRSGGHYGQAREDDYVTLLANSQSENGIAQGAVFCQQDAGVFKQVLALRTVTALDAFASSNPTPQPIAIKICPVHTSHHHSLKPLTVAEAQTNSVHN
jgi:hypothetical protein